MIRFCEKKRYLSLAVAAFYVYVTFTIHLLHTCHLGIKSQHSQNQNQVHCRKIRHNHQFCSEQPEKDRLSFSNKNHNKEPDFCISCLYSASAKATSVCATSILSSFAPTAVSDIKPKETVRQKTQDFTPILLRAPPISTS